MRRYVIGITGASGAIYGVRLVQALLAATRDEVHLVVSPAGERVMAEELGAGSEAFDPIRCLALTGEQAGRLVRHACDDIGAAPASGTFRAEATIICPCSMKTLGALAAGLADNLIARAGDVALKEGRPLILVARETPLSLIHLRNMTRLAEAGAVILPAMPAFYHHPRTIEELVGHLVQKICDRVGVELPEAFRWAGERGTE